MTLVNGSRLGPYEIVAPLGRGGMGEVYKARDTRLDRTVAIKVLPVEWADSPDMKQRFDREAQLIASLNHPNICKLHDIGKTTSGVASGAAGVETTPEVVFLVMEHLDGETLADRLTRGPVPVDEALRIGIAIGDALDKAHRQGVVHRDLKPTNIMLTATGPKLLDFGLAKLQRPVTGGNQATRATPNTPITQAGVILGTLQYMAPEQLDGVEADARTDIFALGVVVHEMVTGKRAFSGKSQVLLISAIATTDPPPLSRVQPSVPPALDHVVKTCLAKDPDDRWQSARDVVAELQWIADGGGAADESAPQTIGAGRQSRGMRLALAGTAVVALAVAVPAVLYVRGLPEPERLELRVSTLPVSYSGNPSSNGTFAVSPDGKQIVVRGRTGGPRFSGSSTPDVLWVGTLDFLNPTQLPGTEGAGQPFWSADGRSIAFVANGKLQKVEASGGRPQPICDVQDFRGGAWNRDGTIVFGSPAGLFSVRAEGGKASPMTTVAASETGHHWPRFLPDGRHYLYLSWSQNPSERAIMAGTIDSKDRTRIMAGDANVAFAEPGYLLFRREGSLYAQPFDADSLTLSGDATRIADHLDRNSSNGKTLIDVSDDGVLVYYRDITFTEASSGEGERQWQLAWVNRVGRDPVQVGKPGVYRGAEVSPDGQRVAVHRHDPNGGDVWVFQPNGTETRITMNASHDNSNPVWSIDGARLTYSSLRNGKWGLYQAAADGSGHEEMLLESELPKVPLQWSPDGRHLLFWVRDPKTLGDIWIWSVADKKPQPLIATAAHERHAQISPDGKWIAYSSGGAVVRGTSGADATTADPNIFVQPFPSGPGRWQVSPDSGNGGDWPRWSRATNELLYLPATGGGSSYSVTPMSSATWQAKGAVFMHETPKMVVAINRLVYPHADGDYHSFSVSPDGQRFLIFQRVLAELTTGTTSDADPVAGITVLMNWVQGLKK